MQVSVHSLRGQWHSETKNLMAGATSILKLEMAEFISFGWGYQRRGSPVFFSVLKINRNYVAFLKLGLATHAYDPRTWGLEQGDEASLGYSVGPISKILCL